MCAGAVAVSEEKSGSSEENLRLLVTEGIGEACPVTSPSLALWASCQKSADQKPVLPLFPPLLPAECSTELAVTLLKSSPFQQNVPWQED